MRTEIQVNSVNDIAQLLEILIQETGIKAEISLLTNGFWLLVVTGTTENHVARCIDRLDISDRFFVRI